MLLPTIFTISRQKSTVIVTLPGETTATVGTLTLNSSAQGQSRAPVLEMTDSSVSQSEVQTTSTTLLEHRDGISLFHLTGDHQYVFSLSWPADDHRSWGHKHGIWAISSSSEPHSFASAHSESHKTISSTLTASTVETTNMFPSFPFILYLQSLEKNLLPLTSLD